MWIVIITCRCHSDSILKNNVDCWKSKLTAGSPIWLLGVQFWVRKWALTVGKRSSLEGEFARSRSNWIVAQADWWEADMPHARKVVPNPIWLSEGRLWFSRRRFDCWRAGLIDEDPNGLLRDRCYWWKSSVTAQNHISLENPSWLWKGTPKC